MSDFVIENGVLKKYTGPGGDVVIPDGVTKIATYAFCCTNPCNVTIGESVNTICRQAFSFCNLVGLTMTKNTLFIGDLAFYNREGLTPSRFRVLSIPMGAGEEFSGKRLFGNASDRKKCELLPLVYPELNPTIIKEANTRLGLIMGYCTAPEKYTGEMAEVYQKEVKRRRKAIIEYAEQAGLHSVLAYFQLPEVPAE